MYRYEPLTGRLTAVTDALVAPNGLAFSRDERLLYVAEFGLGSDPGWGPPHPRLRRGRWPGPRAATDLRGHRAGAPRWTPRGRARQRLDLRAGRDPCPRSRRAGARSDPRAGDGLEPRLRRTGRPPAVHHRVDARSTRSRSWSGGPAWPRPSREARRSDPRGDDAPDRPQRGRRGRGGDRRGPHPARDVGERGLRGPRRRPATRCSTRWKLAVRHGVAVGAHPGYPDREGFGRRDLDLRRTQLRATLAEQLLAHRRGRRRVGVAIGHVKPHGALYNRAARTLGSRGRRRRSSWRPSDRVILVGLAGFRAARRRAERSGLPVAAEAFADRAYEPDGSLRSRSLPGAVHGDPAESRRPGGRRSLATDGCRSTAAATWPSRRTRSASTATRRVPWRTRGPSAKPWRPQVCRWRRSEPGSLG